MRTTKLHHGIRWLLALNLAFVKSGLTAGARASFGPTFISVTVTGGDAGTITATKHIIPPGGLYDTCEISATWWLTAICTHSKTVL